jgi:hypothetical protein
MLGLEVTLVEEQWWIEAVIPRSQATGTTSRVATWCNTYQTCTLACQLNTTARCASQPHAHAIKLPCPMMSDCACRTPRIEPEREPDTAGIAVVTRHLTFRNRIWSCVLGDSADLVLLPPFSICLSTEPPNYTDLTTVTSNIFRSLACTFLVFAQAIQQFFTITVPRHSHHQVQLIVQ